VPPRQDFMIVTDICGRIQLEFESTTMLTALDTKYTRFQTKPSRKI